MGHTKKAWRLILLLIMISSAMLAQNETTKWYFGRYAALDFMNTPPTFIPGSAMSAGEGSASMADGAGNLLFYTNFDTIYNSQNVCMANGANIISNASSCQSTIIVKQPGSSNLYYVFQQSGLGFGNYTGFHYSVVDMSLAAGMGSVTTKNVLIYQNPIWQITEKVTAARHCNGVDVWVIIHEMATSNFRSYLLTSAGLNLTPVISSVGASPGSAACNGCWTGCMKVSPNCRKMAIAHSNLAFQTLDFDPATGILSNPLTLTPVGGYGCEFSPDGSKVYQTYGTTLVQWDLCAGSNAAIAASQTTINSISQKGTLQLAPDGKIYVAVALGFQTTAIGVINNPNVGGVACNYVYPGPSIVPALNDWGLPNFMSDFFLPKPAPFTFTVNTAISCQTASFTAPPIPSIGGGGCNSSSFLYNSMLWDFGDPAAAATNTSALTNPTHQFSAAGSYTVKLMLQRTCGTDTLHKVVTIAPTISISASSQPASCLAGGSATVTASGNGSSAYNFVWLPSGATTPVVNGLSAGIHSVTVIDSGACASTATVLVTLQNNMSGTVTPATVSCPNGGSTGAASILLSGAVGPYTYVWSGNAQTGAAVTGLAPGQHSVTASGAISGCSVALTFQINNTGNTTVTALPSLSVCERGSVNLATAFNGNSFSWSGPNGFSSSQQSSVLSPVLPAMAGVYTITAMDANFCSITSTLALSVAPSPTVALQASKNNLCAPYCTQLKAQAGATGAPIAKTILMIDGRTLPNLTTEYCFTKAGQHVLTLNCSDENNCESSTQLVIQAYPTPVADFEFTPTTPIAGIDEVLFTSTSTGDRQTNWYWFLASDNKLTGIYKTASRLFENAGTQVMALVVQNAWGCADTVVKSFVVTEEFCFYMPDAFTPNDDGKNDVFTPKGFGITSLELQIFDRWGELIFHTNSVTAGWDGSYKGQPCKTDIYVWKAKVTGIDSKTKTLQGHVTLYR